MKKLNLEDFFLMTLLGFLLGKAFELAWDRVRKKT
jgi:hypothetical protein